MSLLHSLTPLALGALDLYRRRRDAQVAHAAEREERDLVRLGESLQRRMQELEASDLEQARITSELTRNVEALVTSLESSVTAARERAARLQRLTWAALAVASSALVLAGWALSR